MNTKLTLRLDEALIRGAKEEASNRGKSVSQMVGEFFGSLSRGRAHEGGLPPVTASMVGVLGGSKADETDYKNHLRRKHS